MATALLAALALPAQSGEAAADAPPPSVRVLPYPIDVPTDFERAIENGTRTRTGEPGPKHWTQFAHYELALSVDPAAKRVTGRAKATYHNRSPNPIDRLVLHLYQDLMRPGQQRTRTVEPTEGFELGEVRIGGDPVRTRARDTLLRLRVDPPIAPGEQRTVEIDYAFRIPRAGTAPRMGYEGEDVIYLAYWYPQFAVFDDVEGWVADPYRGNGEFYMGYADYDVAVTAPVGYVVRATGVLQNPDEVLTEQSIAALAKARESREIVPIVDAAALAEGRATRTAESGLLTWRFRAENVRDVAVSLARTYLWDATHAVVQDRDGDGVEDTCEIHAVYEADAGDWRRAALYAQHTIEFMSRTVHPYPWPHMTCCEGVIGGGMEFPMMTIVGGRTPAGTITHELVHMWFPMLLGSNEKRHAWQDEGFTTFFTTLCRDDFSGNQRGPQRDIVASYGRYVQRVGDVVCARHADTFGTDDFGFASYSKPAAVLHQLRALLGDEVFFAAFRRYAKDWAFKHPYPYDFFHTFETVAGRDLQAYFRTWFYEAWRLDHAIESVEVQDGRTTVRIADRGRAVHPIVVEATFADGSQQRRTVPMKELWRATSVQVVFEGEAVEVVIDPDITSLDCERDDNRWTK